MTNGQCTVHIVPVRAELGTFREIVDEAGQQIGL